MTTNITPHTSTMNSIGGSIACVVVMIIVITTSIRSANQKLGYFEELKNSKWQENKTLITSYHQLKVNQYRDNSQRLTLIQNGQEIYTQFCDAKIKSICNSVFKDLIEIESLTFYVKQHENGFYSSHHLKTITYKDLKKDLQIFNYDNELPNSPHKIYETLKEIWLDNLIMFLIFLFFTILAIAYLPHELIEKNKTRKKLASLILLLTLSSYLYVITQTLIITIKT